MIEDHTAMHVEHRLWESEDSLRRDELSLWSEDIDRALAELKGLEGTLKRHRDALNEEIQSVEGDRTLIQEQERAIANIAKWVDESTPLSELAERHAEQSRHRRDRLAEFEALKKRHYQVMAYWRLLHQALLAPVESGMQRPL
jgi:hypothetical protein